PAPARGVVRGGARPRPAPRQGGPRRRPRDRARVRTHMKGAIPSRVAAGAPAVGALIVAAAALITAACAGRMETVEWTTKGPAAEHFFVERSYVINGRSPSFEEKRRWEAQVEDRVYRYLRDHPELERTTRYMDFRFWWQVT